MADRFYTPQSLGPGEVVLDGAEAHHLTAVRRFAVGDRVVLFNGDGCDYLADIVDVGKKLVSLTVTDAVPTDRELPVSLVVAAAIPKGDRADFLIEKLTELGVTQFIPLTTARSVVVPKASTVAKFERAVIEASKQCGRNRLMAIHRPMSWIEFSGWKALPANRFMLDPTGAIPLCEVKLSESLVIAIGPEGGFAPEELATAIGWTAVTIGSRILRIETAAIAAAAWVATSSRPVPSPR